MRADSVIGRVIRGPWLKDLAVVGLLVVLALKLTHDMLLVRDFIVGDETFYLRFGRDVWHGQPPYPDFGPLYILWYSLLCLLKLDMASLPLLTWRLLAALLPISFYLLMRSAGGGRLTALAGAVLVLTSNVVEVYPYPMHVAAVILALGTALSSRFRSLPPALAGIGLTLLFATYIRPDYSVSLMLFLGASGLLLLWSLVRSPGRWLLLIPPTAVVIGATVVLWLTLGFPSVNGSRSLLAFAQHYANNRVHSQKSKTDPWVEWERLFRADFGDANSVGEALRKNPAAVCWHVGYNINSLPGRIESLISTGLDLAPRGHLLKLGLMNLALVLSVLGLIARVGRRPRVLDSDRGFTVGLIAAVFIAVPTTAQVLLIHPRFHYLIPLTVFATALAGSCLPVILPAGVRRWNNSWAALAAFGLLLAVAVPNRAHGWDVQQWLGWRRPARPRRQDMWNFICLMKGLHVSKPVVVLDYAGALDGRALFSDLDYRMVYHEEKPKDLGFGEFIEKRDISVIVLSPQLIEDSRFGNDPEFQAFLTGSTTLGRFTTFSHPSCRVRVAVRNDVLPAAARGSQHASE